MGQINQQTFSINRWKIHNENKCSGNASSDTDAKQKVDRNWKPFEWDDNRRSIYDQNHKKIWELSNLLVCSKKSSLSWIDILSCRAENVSYPGSHNTDIEFIPFLNQSGRYYMVGIDEHWIYIDTQYTSFYNYNNYSLPRNWFKITNIKQYVVRAFK